MSQWSCIIWHVSHCHVTTPPNISKSQLTGMRLCAYRNTAFDVIFVLYCYSPIRTGGLAFTVRPFAFQPRFLLITHIHWQATEIGLALATSGSISAGLQLFFMPYLLRRFDHAKMYNTCMGIWPYVYALLPGLNVIARWGAVVGEVSVPGSAEGLHVGGVSAIVGVTPGTKALLWVGIGVLLTMARVACLGFS